MSKARFQIIKNPRITEKASMMQGQNVYTFDITQSANKTEIKKAVFDIYKVMPVRVNVLSVPQRRVMVRGQLSVKGGGKKALVYLKEGDKIEFI